MTDKNSKHIVKSRHMLQ